MSDEQRIIRLESLGVKSAETAIPTEQRMIETLATSVHGVTDFPDRLTAMLGPLFPDFREHFMRLHGPYSDFQALEAFQEFGKLYKRYQDAVTSWINRS
jgi:hypothetical protein